MRKRRFSAVAPLVLAIVIAACGGTPGEDRPSDANTGTPADQVKTDGFESLGPVTLRAVWAEGSPGPREAIARRSREFEEKYPNVTVEVSQRDFNSWIKQAKLVASSDDPPDVFVGNQGYQLDGELVKAGLILPLDEYAKAYGWTESYSPESLQQFSWSEDGRTFGEGALWGVAQSGQSTGVFANLAKLRRAGVDPASLRTFEDFDAALAKLRRVLPQDEPVINLGNSEQFGVIHLWGMIQGAYTPAQDMRDWIFHRPGATFDNEGNLQALQKLMEWVDKGYLGRGDAFNARTNAEAATAFARGDGAFTLCGNWNASIAKDGLGDNAAFFDMPPGSSGKRVAIGSTSTPVHISAKTDQPDLAAAYIDFLTGPDAAQALVDTQQVPAVLDATAEPTDRLGREVQQGWQQLVQDGGLTLFPDWSSPTMLQTMGQSFQEMLAGRISPQDVIDRTQSDWEEYDRELGGT